MAIEKVARSPLSTEISRKHVIPVEKRLFDEAITTLQKKGSFSVGFHYGKSVKFTARISDKAITFIGPRDLTTANSVYIKIKDKTLLDASSTICIQKGPNGSFHTGYHLRGMPLFTAMHAKDTHFDYFTNTIHDTLNNL